MKFVTTYIHSPLTLEEISAMPGLVFLEFGENGCPYCQAAQPFFLQALNTYDEAEHIKIEDGKGRRLGRQFKVKLWPTLVVLRDGKEVGRVVRPQNVQEVAAQLKAA